MEGYKVTIKETSKNLTARERIMMKDLSNAVKLDAAVSAEESLTITPASYAVLSVHNEKANGDKDYENYVIVDAGGTKFSTGSPSFWDAFMSIVDEMSDEIDPEAGDMGFSIEVYKKPSKNYKGKSFMTCSIV